MYPPLSRILLPASVPFACYYNPSTNQLITLPGPSNGVSTTFAVSGNGALKVGLASGAYTWNSSDGNTGQPLDGFSAQGVSADGSTVTGASSGAGDHDVATLWMMPERTKVILGTLPGYDASDAVGASANGQIICGRASNDADAILKGAPDQTHSFRLVRGSTLQDLDTLSGYVNSIAYGISGDGAKVVGECRGGSGTGDNGFVWSIEKGMQPLRSGLVSPTRTLGYAISGNGERIVGDNGGENLGAFIWDGNGSPQGAVTAFVAERGKSTGAWHLGYATGISQDGYTICGVGINPSGKSEGWVAVLPPILHPPIIESPGSPFAPPGSPFLLQIKASGMPTNFTAKGLPNGFHISGDSGRITGIWSLDQAAEGIYTITVTAKNADGSGKVSFNFILSTPQGFQKALEGHSFLPKSEAPGEDSPLSSFGTALSANGRVAVGHDGIANDSRAYRWTPTDGISALPMLDGRCAPIALR